MTRRGKRAGRKTYITDAILFRAGTARRDPMESSDEDDTIVEAKANVEAPSQLAPFSEAAHVDFKSDVASIGQETFMAMKVRCAAVEYACLTFNVSQPFKVRVTLMVCPRDAWDGLMKIQRYNDIWTAVRNTCGTQSGLSMNGTLKIASKITDVNIWSEASDPRDVWAFGASKWTLMDYDEVTNGMRSDNATAMCIMSILIEYHKGADAYLKKALDSVFKAVCNAKDTLDFAPIVIRVPPLQAAAIADHLKARLDIIVETVVSPTATGLHAAVNKLHKSALPFSSCLFPS